MGGQTSIQHVKDRFAPNHKNQLLVSQRQQRVSRNNVFKVSGNMALGANDGRSPNDIQNSLRLLKSKQNQKQTTSPLQTSNLYGGSYSSSVTQRQQPAPKNFGTQGQQNQNYSYQQTRNQPASYKDVYQQMEQHLPSNDYSNRQRAYSKQDNETYNQRPRISSKQDYYQSQRTKPQPKTQKMEYRPEPEYKPRGQQRAPANAYEEKNIKELNRENRVQIQEYDPSEFVECGEGCGRKFNPESISKHEAICRKVFQHKRKEFNAQNQRLVANEQKKLMKKGQQVQRKIQQKKAKEKIPKWKAESLQLRAGVKQSRNDDYAPTREEQHILDQARNNGMVKCQFCGRNFNQQAAARHVPFCESQQRKQQIRRR